MTIKKLLFKLISPGLVIAIGLTTQPALLFAEPSSQPEIHISIPEIPEGTTGFIINVYLSKKSFLKTPDRQRYISIDEVRENTIIVTGIEHGQLTLSVTADIKGNKVLDTRIFGIPAEPVGFVNNPKPKFGPPSFEQCLFDHKGSPSIFTVNLKKI